MREFSQTVTLNGAEIKISTGKLATLAQGSVLLQLGGTSVLATTSIDKADTEQDFFPLSVEYLEKMYARGAISGSRFAKREGFPPEEAIIKARQVDHSIRSLFPKNFRKPTSVILTVLSYDQENDPEILAVFGASLSLMLSGAPFYGPCSSVVACLNANDEIVINPMADERQGFKAEFLISGVDGKPLNIEGWGKEIAEEKMDSLLDKGMEVIQQMNALQHDFVSAALEGKASTSGDTSEHSDLPAPEALITKIKNEKYEEIKVALFVEKDKDTDRQENLAKIKTALVEELKTAAGEGKTPEFSAFEVDMAVEYVAKKSLREAALKEGKRVTKRKLDEIRPLSAEVDILPTVHGSALFVRGLTQSLSIVTLGSQSMEQLIDDMEGESSKTFMHHYNMPPFSTGEAGRYNYKPGRREIGHGAIGENALKNMLPSQEDFPYTIRVVSEVLTSNGSTSMAATCASSMALMAAGVPMKEAVAGIGVGLICDDSNEDDYVLLLDIEGIEDFYGDMDFKVTGTKNGITAIQYENKLRGVKVSVLKEAFRVAQKGRQQVLEVMDKAISAPRPEVAPTAPIVATLQIRQDKIGELIGPGGKNIKDVIARSEAFGKSPADINIEDSGKVVITAANRQQLDFVKETIETNIGEAELNKVYTGVVDKIMPYGVFVDVSPSISGLLHVSEIFDKQGNYDLSKTFETGEKINVRVVKMEDGRVNFSIKGLEQEPALLSKLAVPVISTEQDGGGMRDTRRFDNRSSRGGGHDNRRRY